MPSCIPLPAAAVPLDRVWALGMDSEIPVGFVRADYSQQRNDIHFIGLSRNLLAAGASWSSLQNREAAAEASCWGGKVPLREHEARAPQKDSEWFSFY